MAKAPTLKQQEKQKAIDELIAIALDIVSDFDTYGEVLQTDEEGEYGPKTLIERLRKVLYQIMKLRTVDKV